MAKVKIRLIVIGMLIILTGYIGQKNIDNQMVSIEYIEKKQDEKIGGNNESNEPKKITEFNNGDVDNDGIYDEVMLYFDDEVKIKVKNSEVTVLSGVSYNQIFDSIISDQYICEIYVKGNKILIGIAYSYTNKYGSTAELYCYEYKNEELEVIWSSQKELEKNILIRDYEEKNNTINVLIDGEKKKIVLDDEDEESYISFTKHLQESGLTQFEMEFRLITDYTLTNPNYDEIVTRAVVIFGACPITETYYSVYTFSEEGMKKIESWFGSAEPLKRDNLFDY